MFLVSMEYNMSSKDKDMDVNGHLRLTYDEINVHSIPAFTVRRNKSYRAFKSIFSISLTRSREAFCLNPCLSRIFIAYIRSFLARNLLPKNLISLLKRTEYNSKARTDKT